MKVFIGADHRGFALKEQLRTWLLEEGYSTSDCGNFEYQAADDFVDFGAEVARRVVAEPTSLGIVICGSGAGMVMTANKIVGARSSLAPIPEVARHARQHEAMNVLGLASDHLTLAEAKVIVRTFLETPYQPQARFERRLQKLARLEARATS